MDNSQLRVAMPPLAPERDPGEDAELVFGLLYGVLAVLGASLAWAVVLVILGQRFSFMATGIGLFVGRAVVLGMKRVDRWCQIIATVCTVIAVFLGDAFYYAYLISREFGQRLDLNLVRRVLSHFWEIEVTPLGLSSFLLAVVGAVFVLRRFSPENESNLAAGTRP
jgi:hypothetical protein